MDLHISTQGGVPVYQQIFDQLKHLIAVGRLAADQELPPIRKLAERLVVNPNTVARAYRELEHAGWVYTRRGAGTFVSDQPSTLSLRERRRIIHERIQGLLAEAYQLDLAVDEIIDMIRAESRSHQKRSA